MTLGGLLASQLVVAFGWGAIFVLGGALPLAMLPLLALMLPESIAPSRAARSRKLVTALFRDGYAPTTVLLWVMNLLNLLSNFLILLWTPALLHEAGATPSQAIFVTSIYGLGIILGALLTAFLADRFGLERVLTYTAAFAAALPAVDRFAQSVVLGPFGHDLWRRSGYWRLPGRSQRPIGSDLSSNHPVYGSRLRPGFGPCRRHCRAAPGWSAAGVRASGAGHIRRRGDFGIRRGSVNRNPRAIEARLVRRVPAPNRLTWHVV